MRLRFHVGKSVTVAGCIGDLQQLKMCISKTLTLCYPLDEAKAVLKEVANLKGVKVILTKKDATGSRRTDELRELAIRKIISQAVASSSVVDIFDAVGLDKPDIGLLVDEFFAQVKNLPEKNLSGELLSDCLRGKSRAASPAMWCKTANSQKCWLTSSCATRTDRLRPRR